MTLLGPPARRRGPRERPERLCGASALPSQTASSGSAPPLASPLPSPRPRHAFPTRSTSIVVPAASTRRESAPRSRGSCGTRRRTGAESRGRCFRGGLTRLVSRPELRAEEGRFRGWGRKTNFDQYRAKPVSRSPSSGLRISASGLNQRHRPSGRTDKERWGEGEQSADTYGRGRRRTTPRAAGRSAPSSSARARRRAASESGARVRRGHQAARDVVVEMAVVRVEAEAAVLAAAVGQHHVHLDGEPAAAAAAAAAAARLAAAAAARVALGQLKGAVDGALLVRRGLRPRQLGHRGAPSCPTTTTRPMSEKRPLTTAAWSGRALAGIHRGLLWEVARAAAMLRQNVSAEVTRCGMCYGWCQR